MDQLTRRSRRENKITNVDYSSSACEFSPEPVTVVTLHQCTMVNLDKEWQLVRSVQMLPRYKKNKRKQQKCSDKTKIHSKICSMVQTYLQMALKIQLN